MNTFKEHVLLLTTCFGLIFSLIILSSIGSTSGADDELYFPMSMIKIVLPKTDRALQILSQIPFVKIEVLSLNRNNGNTSIEYLYKIENPQDYLKINPHTGEVYVGRKFKNLDSPKSFIVSASNSIPWNWAHMTLEIEPINTESFCSDYGQLCFWHSAYFTVVEDKSNRIFIPQKIGNIGPRIYDFLCPQHEIMSYQLKNATNFVRISNGSMYTNQPFDHDSFNPGSMLAARVSCLIRTNPNSLPLEFQKTINISVLDQNDNGPELQENKGIIFKLDNPHFTKDYPVGQKNIIFLDKDSLAINSAIMYEVHNDTYHMVRPACRLYEADHVGLKNSVINCKIFFARDGILRKSPHCFVLQVKDLSVLMNISNTAEATICITADLNQLHELDRPTALALQASVPNQNRRAGRERKNQRRLLINSEDRLAAEEGLKPISVVYPRDVYVSRLAANLSRIAEPTEMRDLIMRPLSYKFSILEDATGAFAITETAGIVYVKNVTALKTARETIYYITITWLQGTVNLIVHLESGRPTNTTCDELDFNHLAPSCSEVGTKKDCSSFCGIGTNGGPCQWRGALLSGLTVNYSTCSPNLTTCPDNVCDPLEDMTHKQDVFICPQDCSTNVFGPHTSNDNKKGIFAASGICTCDHFGKCACAVHDTFPAKLKKSHKNKTQERKASQILPPPTEKTSPSKFECGTPCLIFVIGCPTLLTIIFISLIVSRKLQSRRSSGKIPKDTRETSENNNPNGDLPMVSLDNEIKFQNSVDSKWEFPRTRLQLDTVLGEGEFGKVVKAYATDIMDRPGVSTVAVKMLKTGANSVEHLALLSEFQLLQEVNHPNVIRLLGACTQGEYPLIIIEYAKFGSLRNYLRLSRKIECAGIEPADGVEPITVKDILSFAYQICKGMSYLTEIKLVHRDLAARNVLLAEGKICKVSDFGLTRDVYEDDAYLKRSKDRVPVKWMAPESLADHVYTTKSDVWAFGILAWELITLGASPYPGVPPQNLYHLLKTGYRMERPENCSEEIYSILRTCWADDPMTRPSFKYLASRWEKLLGNNIKYLELNGNAFSNPVYCQDDKVSQSDLSKTITEWGEPDKLDHLWHSPQIQNDTNDQCTSRDLSDDTGALNIPPGYDQPRPLIEAKNIEQELRYQNELRIPPELDPNHYSVPSKHIKSYVDITNKNPISNNLDTDEIEKNLSKNITFRFSNLLNLNEQATSTM